MAIPCMMAASAKLATAGDEISPRIGATPSRGQIASAHQRPDHADNTRTSRRHAPVLATYPDLAPSGCPVYKASGHSEETGSG